MKIKRSVKVLHMKKKQQPLSIRNQQYSKADTLLEGLFGFFLFGPQGGDQVAAHLFFAVSNDWQIEKLASMLLGQDRVNSCGVWARQLLI